jgi:hypothetical protein
MGESMKHITNEAFAKIQKALFIAFSKKEHMEISDNWRLMVMGHIRKMEPRPEISYAELFQQFVWKLSPVAIAMVIVFLLFMAQTDFIYDYEIARILVEDPIQYSLFAL